MNDLIQIICLLLAIVCWVTPFVFLCYQIYVTDKEQ